MDSSSAEQIQALLVNVEKLTCHNEEMQKIMESHNAECRRIGENQNEVESNSQANRQDKTSRGDSTNVENELRNMRKEMDELKSAMKDKGTKNLDGMIQRTESPFTTEVLNHPLPPKLCLPQLESCDGSKDPLDHIESFKALMLLHMTPDEVMCKGFPTTLKGAARIWFSKIPPRTIANFENSARVLFVISLGGKDRRS